LSELLLLQTKSARIVQEMLYRMNLAFHGWSGTSSISAQFTARALHRGEGSRRRDSTDGSPSWVWSLWGDGQYGPCNFWISVV